MAAVTSPNYGLMFDRPPIDLPRKALRDGLNFRVKNGTLESVNLGWERFSQNWQLNGPVYLIDNFFPRNLDEKLLFGTATDIYLYDTAADTVSYLTPIYDTGTAAGSGTAITGTGTDWSPLIRPGDEITFGSPGVTATNPHGNDLFTKVLLHFGGTDGSTTFVDNAIGGAGLHTWTASGNAQLDTADQKFGSASLLLDGTGDWITSPDSADWTLGSSDFTVDVWFKMGGGDGAARAIAGSGDAAFAAATSAFYLRRNAAGKIEFGFSNGTTTGNIQSLADYTTVTNPGWHHVEAGRTGNTMQLFVDGVLQSTAAFTGSIPDLASVLAIGQRGGSADPFFGWIDEFRLSVGVARHTANFTVETGAYFTQWYEIQSVTNDLALVLTTSAGLFSTTGYTIRRKFSEGAFVEWSFDTFVNDGTSGDDLWFLTNGIDSVATWNGTDATLTLHPELGFTCKTVTTYSNMMIYGNITQAGDFLPSTIINSDVGLPLNAGSTGTGLSEQFVTHSGTDEILNMIPIGDYLVVYCERTLIPIQFIGDPLIFLFRVAISGVGPISTNAIADFGDFHEFIGADAGYLFDGVTLKETNSHLWRDVLRQTDPARRRQAFGHFDEEQGDLIWSIPGNTDPGVGTIGAPAQFAWPEHYLEEGDEGFDGSPFSKRQFPFTATGFFERQVGLAWEDVVEAWQDFNFAWNDQFFQAAFPLNLAGDENGFIYTLNQIQTGNGEVLPSFVRTGRRATRSGRERDLLTRIYPFARTLPYLLEVNLYMGDHVSKEPASKGTQLYNMNNLEGQHFVTFYRRGRVFEISYGSTAGDPWVIEGWDFDIVNGGRR